MSPEPGSLGDICSGRVGMAYSVGVSYAQTYCRVWMDIAVVFPSIQAPTLRPEAASPQPIPQARKSGINKKSFENKCPCKAPDP